MIIFIDVLLVAIIVFSTARFGIKGLVCSILGMGKFIIAFLISLALGSPVGILLANGFVGNAVSDHVYNKIYGYFDGGKSLTEFFANIPDGFLKVVKLFGADVEALEARFGSAQGSETVIREMSDVISGPISRTLSAIIAYVLIFVVAYIVLSIVIKGFSKIKIPIITKIDKLLGITLGLALGVLGVAFISTAIYSILEFISAIKNSEEIMKIYSDSHVFKFIYDLRIFEFIRKLI
ncbi:MAG: CvpA family protein [Clostridia bacterium]|nr:CvpA family protein [Clostridia bacterium]